MGKLIVLPPRWPLIRQLFYLLRRADIADWQQWATDLLGRPITSHHVLTKQDAQDLIDELVLNAGESRACRSLSPDELPCIYNWPGHPLWCTDETGREWLAREI